MVFKRSGRPPIDPSMKAHEYKISMTSAQMKEIDTAAAAVGLGRSEYFRVLHKRFYRKLSEVKKEEL